MTVEGNNSLIVWTQVNDARPPAEHPDTITFSATNNSSKNWLIIDLVIESPLKYILFPPTIIGSLA